MTEVYTVEGGAGDAGKSAAEGSGRVRATFAPRDTAPAATPKSDKDALLLAPSKSLGGGAKR